MLHSVGVLSMQAGPTGCVDFAKPFVMPESSIFKDVGGRANVAAVIYLPDPRRQLVPSQVTQYALHVVRISSLKLPVRPGAPTCPNMYGEVGTSSTPTPLLIERSGILVESDDDDTMTITYPAGLGHSAFDPTFTHPLPAEGGGSNRERRRRRTTMSGVSLSALWDAGSTSAQTQTADVGCSQARNVSDRDVGRVAPGPALARSLLPARNDMKRREGPAGEGLEGTRPVGTGRALENGLDPASGASECTPVHHWGWTDASDDDSGSVHVLSAGPPSARATTSRSTADRRTQSASTMPFADEPLQLDSDASRGTSSDRSGYEPAAARRRRRRRSASRSLSGTAAGADRAADALQEAEDAFMAADLKYNTACEAQKSDALDLNDPVTHVSTTSHP